MLQSFSLQNWIEITIGIFILVPGYIYFKNYRRTGVLEFLYFGILTIIIAVNEFTLIYRDLTGLTILTEQVVDTCINLIILTISLHAIRVKWEHPPVIILGITLGWFLLLQSFVFFYQIIAIPDEAFHLFIDMKKLGDFTVGAGIILGDTIIHANGYIFLVYLYGFYVSLLYLYVYGTTKPFAENIRINFARKLWMTADFFLALFSTLPIGHLLGFWQISLTFVTILSFIALIIIMYIVLRYPEALLFSQAKILTCLDLYGKINSLTTEAEIKAFGMPSLVSYIKNLPPDLLEMQLANLQLGLCFGSFTDQGFVIQAKNKYCTFSDSQLQSMLEFSAVLYEHGDVNKLYGPFPQVKDRLVRKNVGNYFVFGFHHLDSSVTDTRVVSQGGKTLALVLLFYSHEYDIILSRYKHELVSTLNAAVQSNTTLNSAPAFLTQLQNNIMALFIFEDKPG